MTTPKQHALMDEAVASASLAWAQGVEEILDGIDKDECEYDKGWWETSYGAEFGARKKKELLEAFDACYEEGVKAERERVVEWVENYNTAHYKDVCTIGYECDVVMMHNDLITHLTTQNEGNQ